MTKALLTLVVVILVSVSLVTSLDVEHGKRRRKIRRKIVKKQPLEEQEPVFETAPALKIEPADIVVLEPRVDSEELVVVDDDRAGRG